MHIALCDDNVADRKQFERLTKRESDKRAATEGNIYINSFGNVEALLANPMQYDAFYIDMCHTEGITGEQVAYQLIALGVNTPIVLCCSEIDYRKFEFPENVIFLDKPIKVAEFSDSLDHVKQIADAKEHLIELRVEKKTLYVREADIVYAVQRGLLMDVLMQDGSTITLMETARNFFKQLEIHPTFFRPVSNVVLNARYISKIGLFRVTVCDGRKFSLSFKCRPFAKKIYQEFHENGES